MEELFEIVDDGITTILIQPELGLKMSVEQREESKADSNNIAYSASFSNEIKFSDEGDDMYVFTVLNKEADPDRKKWSSNLFCAAIEYYGETVLGLEHANINPVFYGYANPYEAGGDVSY